MRMPHEKEIFDVLVLGAGASGLMCASRAAAKGGNVLLLDHGPKPGRKLAVTGGGKCNCTNKKVSPDDYTGTNPDFCRSALARFTPEHLLSLLHEAGIPLEEREHGQIFCKRSALDIVRWLVDACRATGCRAVFEARILGLKRPVARDGSQLFVVHTSRGEYRGRKAAIALGGPAWPQIGASGVGLEIARSMGHKVIPIRPALVGLVMPASWPLLGLAGVSLPASIRVLPQQEDGKQRSASIPVADNLDLLFTHQGISGPAALQASLYWRKGMQLEINFLPTASVADMLNAPDTGKLLCKNLLRRHFPARLADALCPADAAEVKCASLSRALRGQLQEKIHRHVVSPVRTEGFSKAEVTAGGVSTSELSSASMESRLVPGLYFCGEALDVTGRLGGYNLHWAFASGWAAGESL